MTSDRVAGRLGKLPPEPDRPRLRLQLPTRTVLARPSSRDYLSAVEDWPMYGNDFYGDCVFAEQGHHVETITRYGQGATVKVTDGDVLAAYSAVTGFDPANTETDQGTIMQDGCDYWRKTGIGGHRIVAFAAVNHTDLDQVKAAINVFGSVAIGFSFPAVAMDQFNNGQPWRVVASDGGIQGGHAVQVGAYDDATAMFKVTTWGAVQEMTAEFFARYVDEAWAVISQEWLDANGRSPEGRDLYGLGEDFSVLTGQPNPFPAPPVVVEPPVVVPPTPYPDPPPDPDLNLWQVLSPWAHARHIGPNRVAARAVTAWAAAHGYPGAEG